MRKLIPFLFVLLIFGTVNAQNQGGKKSEEATVKMITQDEFKKMIFDYSDTTALYKGKKCVVVDFYADWCGPCRKLAPIMEDLAKKYAKDVVFYKINVDYNKDIAQIFDIRNIPSLLFVKAKERPSKMIGLPTKSELVKIIDTVLLGKEETE